MIVSNDYIEIVLDAAKKNGGISARVETVDPRHGSKPYGFMRIVCYCIKDAYDIYIIRYEHDEYKECHCQCFQVKRDIAKRELNLIYNKMLPESNGAEGYT